MRIAGRILHRRQVVVSHPRLGWAGWPNLHHAAKTYSRGTFHLTTDSVGRRATYPPGADAPPGSPVLLLVGDSFVQGIGVEDDETVAWKVARALPDRRVVNLGVAGYGTDQMLLAIEEFFRTDSANVADIVVVAYENDFRDVQNLFDYALARSKPAFRLRGRTLDRGRFTLPLLDRAMDWSELVWLSRSKIAYALRPANAAPERGLNLVVACLEAIRRLGTRNGARVTLFAFRQIGPPLSAPSQVADSTWNQFVRSSRVVELTGAVAAGSGPTPIGFDGMHWSSEGNSRAAARILEELAR